MNMTSIICGLVAVVVGLFCMWIYQTIKASKDPDVKEASTLRIPIARYRKYQEAEKKIQETYAKFGTSSNKANKIVSEIISSLPNMNEWRRYSDFQEKKARNKTMDEIINL